MASSRSAELYIYPMNRGRSRRIFLFVGILLSAATAAGQTLDEVPIASGGDPAGLWGGADVVVQVYADPALTAAADDLALTALVSGQLNLDSADGFSLAYVLRVDVALTVLGAPLQVSVRDTVEEGGTYRVDDTTLVLTSANTTDSLSFTAAGDSLTLIRPITLGDLSSLAASVAPEAGSPLGVIQLGRLQESAVSADFDGSGRVDFADFLRFASGFGISAGESGFDPRFDLDGDGTVGFVDFLELAKQFGS